MATYNGAPYIDEQLASILPQLGDRDELIVVDDASSDSTVALIRACADPRIKLVLNERNAGHVASFSRALSLAQNELVIMADQDDRWLPGRVALMAGALASRDAMVVASNSEFMSSDGRPTAYACEGVTAATSAQFAGNIWSIFTGRRRYYGCATALRRNFHQVILPIPAYVESHDLWIAMAGNLARANVHLDACTLARRVHGHNASIVSRPLYRKLWSRIIFAISYFDLWFRLRKI
jgi:glycosyltransferase involved in cell wall biosynthesis